MKSFNILFYQHQYAANLITASQLTVKNSIALTMSSTNGSEPMDYMKISVSEVQAGHVTSH